MDFDILVFFVEQNREVILLLKPQKIIDQSLQITQAIVTDGQNQIFIMS